VANVQDGRSQIVQLTETGEQVFAQHFPVHLEHIEHALSALAESDMQAWTANLRTLRAAFAAATLEN
jgi:DNA-binding MarR family transcriptional regulator